MSDGAAPDLPAAAMLMGGSEGLACAGAVLLGAVVAASDEPVRRVVAALVLAPIFGVGVWLLTRRTSLHMRENASIVEGPGLHGDRVAFGLGLVGAAFVVAVEMLVFAVMRLLLGPESDDLLLGMLPGILAGFALFWRLSLRDLRQWQEATHLTIFRRRRARRLAWTNRQAQAQAVAVRTSERG